MHGRPSELFIIAMYSIIITWFYATIVVNKDEYINAILMLFSFYLVYAIDKFPTTWWRV